MKKRIWLFILGAICFTVSQPLFRIPILNYLQGTTKFLLFYRLNPMLVGILIAFSAGIFEEGFRFIFRVPLSSLYVGILERFLAIILHIGLTVIIWNGFQLNKKYKYLGIAILVHGLVNSLIPILSFTQYWIILIESSLALIDICIIIYIYKSKKYYLQEEVI